MRVSLHLLNENVNFSSSTSEKFHFSLQQYLRDTHDGTSCDSEVMRCGFSGFIVDVKPDKNSHLQCRQTSPPLHQSPTLSADFSFQFVCPSATSSDAYTENSKKRRNRNSTNLKKSTKKIATHWNKCVVANENKIRKIKASMQRNLKYQAADHSGIEVKMYFF